MKLIIIGLTALIGLSAYGQAENGNSTQQANVVELVLWHSKEGVSTAQMQEAITKLNEFVEKQPGFVSRSTGLAEDGQFIDVVYWTDLASAQNASAKAQQNPEAGAIFALIEENNMLFKHFEVFNQLH